MDKEPMNLEDLPQHLKAVRENGNTSTPVVGMGQIVMPEKKPVRWEGLVFAAIMFFAVTTVSMITYDVMTPQQLTVIVESDNGSALPTIVSDSGGKIIAVKQNTESTYEVEISTHKSKRSFLAWLRDNKDIKNVKLKENKNK